MSKLGKIAKIRKILNDISFKNISFPIPVLVNIIAEYVYEPPTNYLELFVAQNKVEAIIDLKDGSIMCGFTVAI